MTFSYDVNTAKVFGVNSAVFLSYLILAETFGTLDLERDKILFVTGMEEDKQKEVESLLLDCGVISMKEFRGNENKNHYALNRERLEKILSAKTPSQMIFESDRIEYQPKQKQNIIRVTKEQKHIDSLKLAIKVDDPLLQSRFCDWIDSVYESNNGFLTIASLKIAEQELLAYSPNNDTRLAIMRIAIKNGYRDLTWAIKAYESSAGKSDLTFVKYDDIKSDGSKTVEEVF